MGMQQGRKPVNRKRARTREAFVENAAERIHVGAGIDLGATDEALRCHVVQGADRRARCGQRVPGGAEAEDVRDPEVDQVNKILRRDQQV